MESTHNSRNKKMLRPQNSINFVGRKCFGSKLKYAIIVIGRVNTIA